MSWENETGPSRQTYKLGDWESEEGAPRRVVLYSPHTRRIFVPRLDDRPAVDLAKSVGTLASARKLVKALVLDGKFEPIPGGCVKRG